MTADRERSRIHFIAACALVAILLGGVWVGASLSAPAAAPAITFSSIDGRKLALDALRGQVVLVNFWATYCSVCLHEMPAMAQTYTRYRPRGFEAIFVAMPYDRPDRVLEYARRNALPFVIALDVQAEAARAFGGIRGTPTTFVVDKRGRIVQRILGEPDFLRLHALIEAKLAERG